MDIYMDNRQDLVDIGEDIEEAMKEAIGVALDLEKHSRDYEISISIVDNEEIHGLNKEYRDVDRETDVLSFPLDDDFQVSEMIILGDIIISAEKALEQAEDLGHSFLREMVYLTVHSIFHLMGYDHLEEDEKKVMREREKLVLKELEIYK